MNIWIVQDAEQIPLIDGAISAMRYPLIAEALCVNHHVTWWTSSFNHSTKRFRRNEYFEIDVNENYTIKFLHATGYKKNISLARYVHQKVLARQFFERIENEDNPDLIICSLPLIELCQVCVEYGISNRIPVVVDVMDQWPDIYLSLFDSRFFKTLFKSVFFFEFKKAQFVLKNCTSIIAVSDTYLDWALNLAERPKTDLDRVFYLGANEPKPMNSDVLNRFALNKESFFISFVGTFGYSYDLVTVIEAACALQKYSDITFILIGDGDNRHQLECLAQGLTNIKFTGWLDENNIDSLLAVSRIALAVYSKKALQSLPTKPFEYMSSSLPIIHSLGGEFSDLVTKHSIGIRYEAGNSRSLVDAILILYRDASKRKFMARNSRNLYLSDFQHNHVYDSLSSFLVDVREKFCRFLSY